MELTYERIEERDLPVTVSQVQAIAADIVRLIGSRPGPTVTDENSRSPYRARAITRHRSRP